MKHDFLLCGLTGWCLEILFTSLGSIRKKDMRLIGQTSVWMFPIYGTAAIIRPFYHHIEKLPALIRSIIYATGIFGFEFFSGSLLKKHHLCPWDYSDVPTNINGVIRLDYAPVWMITGLIFERVLSLKKCQSNCQNRR